MAVEDGVGEGEAVNVAVWVAVLAAVGINVAVAVGVARIASWLLHARLESRIKQNRLFRSCETIRVFMQGII